MTGIRPPIVRARRAAQPSRSTREGAADRVRRPDPARTEPVRNQGVFRPAEPMTDPRPVPGSPILSTEAADTGAADGNPATVVSEAYRLLDGAVQAGREAAWRQGQTGPDLSTALERFAAPGSAKATSHVDPAQLLATLAGLAQPIAGIAQALSQMHARNTGTDLGSVWPVPRWDRVDVDPPTTTPPSPMPTARAWEPIEPEDDDMSAAYPSTPPVADDDRYPGEDPAEDPAEDRPDLVHSALRSSTSGTSTFIGPRK